MHDDYGKGRSNINVNVENVNADTVVEHEVEKDCKRSTANYSNLDSSTSTRTINFLFSCNY